MCVAGIDLATYRHIRPVLPFGRLAVALLQRSGGLFDIASIIDLGVTTGAGSVPEIEDEQFALDQIHSLGKMEPTAFWELLSRVTQPSLKAIFGTSLHQYGRTCAVDENQGQSSLGCLRPANSPFIRVWDSTIRLEFRDPVFGRLTVRVTDLRMVDVDGMPRMPLIDSLNERMANGVEALLSVGLARAWQREPDEPSRHWLQINNLHLADDPNWRVA